MNRYTLHMVSNEFSNLEAQSSHK